MGPQLEPTRRAVRVAEGDHVAEFPGRINMQQWEWQTTRIEGLEGEMQQDGRILPDRVEQDRIVLARRLHA